MAQPEPRQPTVPGQLETVQKLQTYLNSCPPGLTHLNLSGSIGGHPLRPAQHLIQLHSLAGVQFPHELTTLNLSHNQITSLSGVQFPPGLTELFLQHNQIASLTGVQFPPGLTLLYLRNNRITSLQGMQFLPNLQHLDLGGNQIASLAVVQFPRGLSTLDLSTNQITTLEGVQFPRAISNLNIGGNPLTSLAGVIGLNNIIDANLMKSYPSLYLRDIEGEKAARQSQKAEFARMNELTQQSMHNQLKAITSFLREGMEARARQHEEQLQKDNERGRHVFFVRGPTRKTYPIPFDPTMTIQAVLDYLNTNYYISALEDCGGIQLSFSAHKLEPERKLADYNVQTESTLNMFYKFKPNLFQGGSKKRTKKSKQQRNKSTKKRT